MREFVYEDLFTRPLGYLRQGGIALTRDTALATLKLIEELLVSDSRNAIEQVVVELPKRIEIAHETLPLPCPPLNRESISYWRD